MSVPLVSFICWNRAGLTAQNLQALLESTDDFELYIVDSNSLDNTWDYLMTLKDPRIKEIKKMDFNRGCIYNLNYILSKRKKDQYFFHIDSDTHIVSKDWISQFMKIMDTFPEVGALSAIHEAALNDQRWINYFKHQEKEGLSYEQTPFIVGWCLCMRPEVFELVGYFNEETYWCDIDMSDRIYGYTPYKMGVVSAIKVERIQRISCENCPIKDKCTLDRSKETCFDIHAVKYASGGFPQKYPTRQKDYLNQVRNHERTIYCPSIHDPESMKKYYYNKEQAEENFQFYIDYSN